MTKDLYHRKTWGIKYVAAHFDLIFGIKMIKIIASNNFKGATSQSIATSLHKLMEIAKLDVGYPGESYGLQLIPKQFEVYRIIPEFLSEPNSCIPI